MVWLALVWCHGLCALIWGVRVVLVQIDGTFWQCYDVCSCWLWFAIQEFEHRVVQVGSASDAGAVCQPGL